MSAERTTATATSAQDMTGTLARATGAPRATLEAMSGFDDHVGALARVGLADVYDVSSQARYDRKHLIHVESLDRVLDVLDGRFDVLEVAGQRTIGYHSVYFDTPQLTTYHDHRMGRRRRYKIRSRHYGDPAATMLEVKCKGSRGQTVKYRTAHVAPSPSELGDEGLAYTLSMIREHYHYEPYRELGYSLETRFVRTTLVNLDAGERLTIDRWLHVADGERTAVFDPGWVIAETKTVSRHAISRHALRFPGARAGRMSKYCLGVAELRPGVPSNPWRRAHRRLVPEAG